MEIAGSILLYVEDEEFDRMLMEMAFARVGLAPLLRMVSDGRAAIQYLSGCGPFANRANFPMPAVVLLDLHLPEMHGFDVLKWIRSHPLHGNLPVVVFTSSERPEDQTAAESLRANDFLVKPSAPHKLREIVKGLGEKWLTAGQEIARN